MDEGRVNSLNLGSCDSEDPGLDPRHEELLAHYLDRLNHGEKLDREKILAEHPDCGEGLLKDLEAFVGLTSAESNEPLGTLGGYTLRRQIGRGGMGVVYEAWQNSLDRQVALKVLPAGVAADAKSSMRFLREAQIVAKLSHPQIVPVFASGIEGGTPWYAMELVEGETLAQVLKRLSLEEIDPKRCLDLAAQFAGVADGLHHAHSKKIIHRDIKPSNLILDREGQLRILDFGLARLEGQETLTLSGDFLGTPQYMSPEQARRKKIPIDHRTDIYSLGTTLYEALTLEPPFRGKDHQDTLSQIIERDPVEPRKRNSRVPRDLETIVLKCLRKDAADRYGTAEALAQDLRRFTRGDPIEARAQTPWERGARRAWRAKWKIGLGTLLLLFSALILSVLSRHAADVRARQEAVVRREVLKFDSLINCLGYRKHIDTSSMPYYTVEDLSNVVIRLKEAEDALPQAAAVHYHRARVLVLLARDEEAKMDLEYALRLDGHFVPAIALTALLLDLESDAKGAARERARAREFCREDWQRHWLGAHFAILEGRWNDAAASWTRLVELGAAGKEPYLGSLIEALLGRGLAHFEAKENYRAAEDFTAAEILWPGHAQSTLLKGQAYFRAGHKDLAAEEFEKAFAEAESPGVITTWISAAYMYMQDARSGLEWVTRPVQGVAPRVQAEREAMASSCLDWLGRFEESIAAGKRAVDLDPGSPKLWEQLGWNYHHRFFTDRAEECFQKALDLDAHFDSSYVGLGFIANDRGEHDKAVAFARQALRMNPSSFGARLGLGVFLAYGGHPEEAEKWLRAAIDLDNKNSYAWGHLADLLESMGRLEEAIAAAERAAECSGAGLTGTEVTRGLALLRLGRRDEAICAFQKAAASGIQPFAKVLIGDMLDARGESLAALDVYLQAAETDPKMSDAHAKIFALLGRKGMRRSFVGSLSRLPSVLESAWRGGVQDPNLLSSLAILRMEDGSRQSLEEALALIERAAEATSRKDPSILNALGEVRFRLGQQESAVELLKEALRLPGAKKYLLDRAAEYRSLGLPGAEDLVPEPISMQAQRLRTEGRVLEAAEEIKKRLDKDSIKDPDSWALWAALCFHDLERTPAQMLEELPPAASEGPGADLRWLVERLVGGETIRINCGGGEHHGSDGALWSKDKFFTSGRAAASFHGKVKETKDPALYQSERWFPADEIGPSSYRLPLPQGRYRVTLHFAEVWFGAAGLRKFDALIAGAEVLHEYDPFAAAGGFGLPRQETRVIQVEDGLLEIQFISRVDNPMISAIEIERVE